MTTKTAGGAWSPFRQTAFTVLWVATVVSNIGTWMNDVGAGWLMTSLAPSPQIVAMVQAATTLPVFLFAVLAGAVADIIDRRKLLLIVNIGLSLVAFVMAGIVQSGAMTPVLLLIFTFLLGSGAAFIAPAWQAIVPKLVPRSDLTAAVALNSMGINISRAIGPALAGVLIAAFGLTWPFVLNAISTLVVIAALIWWKPARDAESKLPAEHVLGAMIAGVRYAAVTRPLRLVLVRAAAFFLFASAFWAMLPLVARQVLGGGAGLYGTLLASVGVGAVAGALLLPGIRAKLGPDRTVMLGTAGTALVLALIALIPTVATALIGGLIAGASWIAVLSSLNVAAQSALPDWVRARGLAIFLTVFSGSMSLGSLGWGTVAAAASIPTALLIAAIGLVIAVPLTLWAKLGRAGEDHQPAHHWPTPEADPTHDAATTIWIAYDVPAEHHARFYALMQEQRRSRRAHGAYGWVLRQDATDPTRHYESWHETSWLSHLRHHDRVTVAEKALQDDIRALLTTKPLIHHTIAHRKG
ncbi:MFS transporter [Paracoccus laeviglucosivorans]|uniref:Predicted arabinose efflux permease, MFS family n=1 Tax=Paracoccus laeviglucosivorans TaxID=1197861 RepID=A0A521CYF1_9RHOB|nr:MFS transporter [Paracoccus laeviglucosivorans]SMO64463.1 Predicted arabinose efflux permease, MFS family [Paracoccus laeviglucosivorans]